MYFIVIEDVDFDINNDAIVTCELAQLWKDGALTDEEIEVRAIIFWWNLLITRYSVKFLTNNNISWAH